MSYIDTFQHELVGYLAGLPLYHPLVTVDAPRTAYDFGCSPQNLVLGGGSGEHPAIVFHDLELLAQYYLEELSHQDSMCVHQEVFACLADSVTLATVLERCLAFCGWAINDYASFKMRSTSETNLVPYSPEESGSVENWLVLSVGEFVWRSFPELIPGLVAKLGSHRKDLLAHPCLMPNILCISREHHE